MEEYLYELRIPKDRVAVLIGKKGEQKKALEAQTGCTLEVDSKEGEIKILGSDSLALYTLKELIRAIGRGFNPEIALRLLKQDYNLEVISITDYAKGKSHFERLRGRVIGTKGKSRSNLEQLTNCSISVYGKTIAIIGSAENVATAKRAVESLLAGSPHSSVYKWLEKQQREP
ncbi:RNA-processing protein [Candidatus Woesearchaeota archaeon]|nr:RNA-processing protein [Candidatus Woesearchaeota archaeon]